MGLRRERQVGCFFSKLKDLRRIAVRYNSSPTTSSPWSNSPQSAVVASFWVCRPVSFPLSVFLVTKVTPMIASCTKAIDLGVLW